VLIYREEREGVCMDDLSELVLANEAPARDRLLAKHAPIVYSLAHSSGTS
jgi:hypothetical protein